MQSVILTLDGAVETFSKGMRWMPPEQADRYCAEHDRRTNPGVEALSAGRALQEAADRRFDSEAELIAAHAADRVGGAA